MSISQRVLLTAGLSVAALVLSACQAPPCTSAPANPIGSPVSDSEWKASVRNNCFGNLSRLNRWFGKTTTIVPKQSPAQFFIPVGEARLNQGIDSGNVVVLVHGWAPGFRGAVDRAGGRLLWWQDGATNSDGIFTSDWAWVATRGDDIPLTITETGTFQEIIGHDADAIVLGYSWIDDSSTIDDSFVDLEYVYRSEAYTSTNGLRLANALEQTLGPRFWSNPTNTLQLIGHSHGSKVATVATLALQQRGRRVHHLTTLDSPESSITLEGNGANLLGFYLNQINTNDGIGATSGTFVDNYVSYFGVAFQGTTNANRIVNTILNPEVYSCTSAGDRHSYSAEWYGGAAAAAKKFNLFALGLDWPPPQIPNRPALNQRWRGGITEPNQWPLTAGLLGSLGCLSSAKGCIYSSTPTVVKTLNSFGNTSGNPTGTLTMSASGNGVISGYRGSTGFGSSQFGIGFDLEWTNPQDGDYLVITGSTDPVGTQEVLFVMDGKSAITGRNPVAINAFVVDSLEFFVYFLPTPNNRIGRVTLSGLAAVNQDCPSTADLDQEGDPDAELATTETEDA
ncbi:MAG: hypothetical protein AAF604_20175 [Acidobacteriota bacterium]